jgi:hypothetical protein
MLLSTTVLLFKIREEESKQEKEEHKMTKLVTEITKTSGEEMQHIPTDKKKHNRSRRKRKERCYRVNENTTCKNNQ